MKTKTKVKLTYFTLGTYFFLGGIEYAVILPTLWLYVNDVFKMPAYYLGIVLSVFSMADLVSGPVFGKISDVTGQTKWLLVFTNLLQIVGSFIYIINWGPEFLIISRLITGLGSGVSGSLMADLAKTTSNEQRTSTFAMFMALRQVGLVIGPGCNIFLSHFDFTFLSFPVNKYTSPGFFLMVLWCIHELMALFLFWNLPKICLAEHLEQHQQHEDDSDATAILSSPLDQVDAGVCVTDLVHQSRVEADVSDCHDNGVDEDGGRKLNEDDVDVCNDLEQCLNECLKKLSNKMKVVKDVDNFITATSLNSDNQVILQNGLKTENVISEKKMMGKQFNHQNNTTENVFIEKCCNKHHQRTLPIKKFKFNFLVNSTFCKELINNSLLLKYWGNKYSSNFDDIRTSENIAFKKHLQHRHNIHNNSSNNNNNHINSANNHMSTTCDAKFKDFKGKVKRRRRKITYVNVKKLKCKREDDNLIQFQQKLQQHSIFVDDISKNTACKSDNINSVDCKSCCNVGSDLIVFEENVKHNNNNINNKNDDDDDCFDINYLNNNNKNVSVVHANTNMHNTGTINIDANHNNNNASNIENRNNYITNNIKKYTNNYIDGSNHNNATNKCINNSNNNYINSNSHINNNDVNNANNYIISNNNINNEDVMSISETDDLMEIAEQLMRQNSISISPLPFDYNNLFHDNLNNFHNYNRHINFNNIPDNISYNNYNNINDNNNINNLCNKDLNDISNNNHNISNNHNNINLNYHNINNISHNNININNNNGNLCYNSKNIHNTLNEYSVINQYVNNDPNNNKIHDIISNNHNDNNNNSINNIDNHNNNINGDSNKNINNANNNNDSNNDNNNDNNKLYCSTPYTGAATRSRSFGNLLFLLVDENYDDDDGVEFFYDDDEDRELLISHHNPDYKRNHFKSVHHRHHGYDKHHHHHRHHRHRRHQNLQHLSRCSHNQRLFKLTDGIDDGDVEPIILLKNDNRDDNSDHHYNDETNNNNNNDNNNIASRSRLNNIKRKSKNNNKSNNNNKTTVTNANIICGNINNNNNQHNYDNGNNNYNNNNNNNSINNNISNSNNIHNANQNNNNNTNNINTSSSNNYGSFSSTNAVVTMPTTTRDQSNHHNNECSSSNLSNDVFVDNSQTISVYRELFTSEMIALLFLIFVSFFNQLALETLLTPLTKRYLSWGEMENSYLYCLAGLEIIVVFLLLRPISKKVDDRWLILIGSLLQLTCLITLIAFVPLVNAGVIASSHTLNLLMIISVVFINLISLPLLMLCSNSLFSKLVPMAIQGFSQGIRKVFGGVGTILGPLWTGGMLDRPIYMFLVMIIVNCFALGYLLLSFPKLNPAYFVPLQLRRQHYQPIASSLTSSSSSSSASLLSSLSLPSPVPVNIERSGGVDDSDVRDVVVNGDSDGDEGRVGGHLISHSERQPLLL